jgi:hypothetical protein
MNSCLKRLLMIAGGTMFVVWPGACRSRVEQNIDTGNGAGELPPSSDSVVDIEITPISQDRLRFALAPYRLPRAEVERIEPWLRRFVQWQPPPNAKLSSVPFAEMTVIWKSGRRLKLVYQAGYLYYSGQRHYEARLSWEESRYLADLCEVARMGKRHAEEKQIEE